MDKRALVRYLLSPWVLLGAAAVGVVLLIAALLILWMTRPGPGEDPAATAVLQVIEMPTITPTASIPTPDPLATPTLPVPGEPGNIVAGAFVQVSGTGGEGLRLRSSPGLVGEVLFLGLESEVFQVTDGPRDADGYTWWYLVAPYDETVQGWAVANYMKIVQQP